MDVEITCPRCKTSKYRNPSLRLLFRCEACVDLIFGTRASGHCPECHITLKRSGYHYQVFQDSFVEREVEIRKRLSREVFNKTKEDFENLRLYNDYLEYVEDIVFELLESMQNKTNDILVESAKKKIEQYKKENKDLIMKNKGKLSDDQLLLLEIIEQEKSEYQQTPILNVDDKEFDNQGTMKQKPEVGPKINTSKKKKHRQFNDTLLEELANSDLPADIIVKTHNMKYNNETRSDDKADPNILIEGTSESLKEKIQNKKTISSMLHFGISDSDIIDYDHYKSNNNLQVDYDNNSDALLVPYEYKYLDEPNYGPKAPDIDSLKALGFIHNIRVADQVERTGGFSEKFACHRALQEAFSGLFYAPSIN